MNNGSNASNKAIERDASQKRTGKRDKGHYRRVCGFWPWHVWPQVPTGHLPQQAQGVLPLGAFLARADGGIAADDRRRDPLLQGANMLSLFCCEHARFLVALKESQEEDH